MVWDEDVWYGDEIKVDVTGQVVTNVTGQENGVIDAQITIDTLGIPGTPYLTKTSQPATIILSQCKIQTIFIFFT